MTLTADEFTGKVAVVTGAARGLGRAISTLLIDRGAEVCILDRQADTLDETASALGPRATPFAVDCTDEAALVEVRRQIIERFGGVDVVINNAGGWRHTNVRDVTVEAWHRAIDMNATTALLTTRTFMDALIERAGRVVCIVSIDAYVAKPTLPDYAAAKAAVGSLVKTFAIELAPQGVLVNGVSPGAIATDIAKSESWLPGAIASTPTGRAAEPEDIAEVVLFLASGRNRVVTGETVIASGGKLML